MKFDIFLFASLFIFTYDWFNCDEKNENEIYNSNVMTKAIIITNNVRWKMKTKGR